MQYIPTLLLQQIASTEQEIDMLHDCAVQVAFCTEHGERRVVVIMQLNAGCSSHSFCRVLATLQNSLQQDEALPKQVSDAMKVILDSAIAASMCPCTTNIRLQTCGWPVMQDREYVADAMAADSPQ